MAFDYKKEYKEFYLPPKKAQIVDLPKMQFVAVRGKGNPNDEDGEYQSALNLLYGISYTIKMSKMGDHRIKGYFDYVVPPLEGLWWQEGIDGIDYSRKEDFNWISMIRLPDFVSESDFEWAKKSLHDKKGLDSTRAEFFTFTEGCCVQIMHLGSYDDEPATVKAMDDFVAANSYTLDFSKTRLHHEIYLSDPRKCAPEKLKTVIRHPVRKTGE
ncbi:MAG: GyrI-like domain-containing protein [Treponema sp.]|nr:GyrI-like domain-containing protein [Treponema sp.]MBP5754188.1 GyrI-like domain-containing protein [Treponema sp.]